VIVGGGVAFEDEVQVSFPGRFSLQKPLEDKSFVSDIGSATLKYKSRANGLTVQKKLIIEELEIPKERFSDLKSIISLAKNQDLSEIELEVNR
jgi:hypothetical protein